MDAKEVGSILSKFVKHTKSNEEFVHNSLAVVRDLQCGLETVASDHGFLLDLDFHVGADASSVGGMKKSVFGSNKCFERIGVSRVGRGNVGGFNGVGVDGDNIVSNEIGTLTGRDVGKVEDSGGIVIERAVPAFDKDLGVSGGNSQWKISGKKLGPLGFGDAVAFFAVIAGEHVKESHPFSKAFTVV